VLAAQCLGITEVPVMVAAGWSEAQKRAYVIADNKLAPNAGWDVELLAVELGDLKSMGFYLGLTGFGELELGKLLPDEAGDGDPDQAPIRWRSRSAGQETSGSAASTGCSAAMRRYAPMSIDCSTVSWPTWPFAIHRTL
jgi:hypothetical protein